MSEVGQKNASITLKGSATMVKHFLDYAISNILYQRSICPPEYFKQTNYYGLNLFTMENPNHVQYISKLLNDLENFILAKEVRTIKLIIMHSETREYFEKWSFDVNYEDGILKDSMERSPSYETKDPQIIRNEISAVIRQILGATTVLPLHFEKMLKYRIHVTQMPGIPLWPGWSYVTDNQNIKNEETLELRSFSTSIYKIDTKICYKGV